MNRVVEEKRGLFRFIFLLFSILMAISFLLLILAMIYYPGGNFAGLDIERFSVVYNGLCDMKELLALNGEPNILSSVLLKVSIIFLSVATVFFFIALCFFFQGRKSTKYLSIIGSFFWYGSRPPIRFDSFSSLIFRSAYDYRDNRSNIPIPCSYTFYTIAYFIDGQFPKLNLYSFLILSIISIVLSIVVGIGSGIGGDFNLIINRLGTNLSNFLSYFIYIIQGLSLFFYLRKQNQIITD